MKVGDFHYDLPETLIAQEPAPARDASRLMMIDRCSGTIDHRVFKDLPDLLRAGDLLVVNDTRVIPARIAAAKSTGGRIEVLLLERTDGEAGARGGCESRQEWRALVRGFGRHGSGSRFTFPGGLTVEIVGREEEKEIAQVVLTAPSGVARALELCGRPPTPPYIRREADDPRLPSDKERYQTVYAAADGAVAAPTAGLHFTPALIEAIRERGVGIQSLTLHVGWGTFKPVRTDRVEDHRVDPERCAIPSRLAEAFAAARATGARVVAVGTTVTRALEHAAGDDRSLRPGTGLCDLFIRPGHRFRAVDVLITNFHLPGSSLLMLVAAFAGRELILRAYQEAVRMEYRFYSYGDAMLIL